MTARAGKTGSYSPETQRRYARERYDRHWRGGTHHQTTHVTVPDDVTVLERDPSPCFMCGVAGACRHRPWMLGE